MMKIRASDPDRYTIKPIDEGAEFFVERSSNNGDDDDDEDEDEETEFAIKQTSNDEKAEDDEYQRMTNLASYLDNV